MFFQARLTEGSARKTTKADLVKRAEYTVVRKLAFSCATRRCARLEMFTFSRTALSLVQDQFLTGVSNHENGIRFLEKLLSMPTDLVVVIPTG